MTGEGRRAESARPHLLDEGANESSFAVLGPPPAGRIQNRCRVRFSTVSRSMS